MLELATAAFAEMAAGRRGMVRTVLERAIGKQQVARRGKRHMLAARGDSVALGGDADDLFGSAHRQAAKAAGMRPIRSLALNAGPALRAAFP